MRYEVYEAAEKWDLALVVAEHLKEVLPENQWGYFYTAYVLHELKRTQEAYDMVKAVIQKFPEHQLMHFNPACYSCQLGKLKESMEWLEKAIDMKGGLDVRSQALEDPDLEPLWAQIGEI
jgi:tetratricopeptide (TPR) repeat protein